VKDKTKQKNEDFMENFEFKEIFDPPMMKMPSWKALQIRLVDEVYDAIESKFCIENVFVMQNMVEELTWEWSCETEEGFKCADELGLTPMHLAALVEDKESLRSKELEEEEDEILRNV
jgi:hypothetical protein